MRRIIIIFLFICAFAARAQEYEYSEADICRPPILAFLNHFSITVSTGYNSTKYKHDLSGYYLLQSNDAQLITVNNGPIDPNAFPDTFQNWFNGVSLMDSADLRDLYEVPYQGLPNPVNNPLLQQGFKAFDADSLDLGFKDKGWGIPINLAVRFNYQDFRIGFGISGEYHKVNSLAPTNSSLGIRNYQPNFNSSFFFKYYGQLGYKFWDFWDYSFAGELEIGKYNMGNNFTVQNGVFYNLGISIEKNISEYFRIILKQSYEIKSYDVQVPLGPSIKHSNNSYQIHFGASITIPELRRSPMKSDHVQLKHVIRDPETGKYMEVRGQPFWKRQNPKVGENHRKLWRYKNKNKKKLNPY
ncbi:MAG: hypothetical protein JXR07_09990 [Reichenbachiella sp.]